MLDFLIWTLLPMALTAAATLRIGGDKLSRVFALAREILASAKNAKNPREAVLEAIERVFLDEIDDATRRLDAEVTRYNEVKAKPSLVDEAMDGMDVEIIPRDGTEEFHRVFSPTRNSEPARGGS